MRRMRSNREWQAIVKGAIRAELARRNIVYRELAERLAWHYGEAGGSGAGNGLDGGREDDAGGAQGEAGGGSGRRAEAEAGAVVLDFGFGERVEIGEDRRPR